MNDLPKPELWLLRMFVRDTDADFAIGDLTETFLQMVQERGRLRARWRLWMEVIRSLPKFIKNSFYWTIRMFINHITVGIRNLRKNKIFSLINVTGFAVGLSAAVLTYLFVLNEVRVNTHYEDLDQIYWVKVKYQRDGEMNEYWGCPSAVGPFLKDTYPEILASGVMINGSDQYLIKSDRKKFKEHIKLGQFSLFKVFSHEVLKGAVPGNDDTHCIVIDDEIAEKYFGSEDPIGKTLQLHGKYDLKVAAVFKSMTRNATDRFKILVPFKLIDQLWRPGNSRSWENHAFRVFVKVRPDTDIAALNARIDGIIVNHNSTSKSHPFLYPFKKKYLVDHEAIENVRTYGIITILLLLVAVINYINLSGAQAVKRAREVGIRKVVGAGRKQIVLQFLSESLLITFMALVLSSLFLAVMYPLWQQFNRLTIPLSAVFSDGQIFFGMLMIVLFTVLLSSGYPALVLSSFLPRKVLQGDLSSGKSGRSFRSVSVVIQFTVSIALMIITATVAMQIRYMKNKKLGFNAEQIVTMNLRGTLRSKSQLLKTRLQQVPGIKNVSLSSFLPGSGYTWSTDNFFWRGKPDDFTPYIDEIAIDENFLETYGIRLLAGEKSRQSIRPVRKVLINRTLANTMGMENVIGEAITLRDDNRSYTVIGVMEDYHHNSVQNRIRPIIFYTDTERMSYQYLGFKFDPRMLQGILKEAEKIVSSIETEYPFAYSFLDREFADWYDREERLQMTVQSFGLIAILVSCLGLFGMTIFTTHRRTREIGIRKALGAGTREIIFLLLRNFTKWVLIANILGWPIAYLYLRNWINDFTYRIPLGAEVYVFSGILILLLAVLTVIGLVYRAARRNPGITLRTD